MKFDVYGPYEIPRGKRGAIIKPEDSWKDFWGEIEANEKGLSTAIGCYVFAFKARKNPKPYYVGKTEKAFNKEVLHSEKIQKYNQVLDKYRYKGRPLLFLLPKLTDGGKFSKKSKCVETRALELILITQATAMNKDIKNIHGKKRLLGIEVIGFMNSNRLAKDGARKQLRNTFGR